MSDILQSTLSGSTDIKVYMSDIMVVGIHDIRYYSKYAFNSYCCATFKMKTRSFS